MVYEVQTSVSRTCGSVRSSLSTHAWLVTVASEAVETTTFAFGRGSDREEASGTASVTAVRGLGWVACPTHVNCRAGTVKIRRAKDADRLKPKGNVVGCSLCAPRARGHQDHRCVGRD